MYAITCFGRELNQMILTKEFSCSPIGEPNLNFSFSLLEEVLDKKLDLAFFSETEVELLLSRDCQDHQEIRGILQSHWQRHILDHNNFFDITPVVIEIKI